MKRQSVDQKQVLHHRNVEDERHRLQSALTDDVDETTSSDVDNIDDIPASPSSSQPGPDNERVSVESVPAREPSEPTVIPNDGMYHLCTFLMVFSLLNPL